MPMGSQGGALLPKQPQSFPYVIVTMTGDGVLTVGPWTYWLTKGSAAAITLPVPTASQIGMELIVIAGSAFAHVVTGTGLLDNGTTGGPHNTWTSAAFIGSSVTLEVMPNLRYTVTGQTLGTVA